MYNYHDMVRRSLLRHPIPPGEPLLIRGDDCRWRSVRRVLGDHTDHGIETGLHTKLYLSVNLEQDN
jgi:hypothetical protein